VGSDGGRRACRLYIERSARFVSIDRRHLGYYLTRGIDRGREDLKALCA
jgi:hypothetical protein